MNITESQIEIDFEGKDEIFLVVEQPFNFPIYGYALWTIVECIGISIDNDYRRFTDGIKIQVLHNSRVLLIGKI